MHRSTGPLALATALALGACSLAPSEPAPSRALLLGLNAADDAGRHTISGRVLAPAGVAARLISNDGGSIVAQGGGNLISNDGGSRHLEAAGDAPLANARVWLTDSQGQPLAGVAPVLTDVGGRFTVHDVPLTAQGLVRAEAALGDGRPTWLECPLGADVDVQVDLATTLATAALAASGTPLDATAFARAAATFEAAPPEGAVAALGDRAALGRLAATAVPTGVATPAPAPNQTIQTASTDEAPAPEPSLLCVRMQPKLGAPPTTICTPYRH
ncbi:MAG: hypothetical protein JWM80_3410 [Cyanobacteria bacterium RYN_339]|nr:hypothetical protein [Cyanobacteria bacterium RYN_339]